MSLASASIILQPAKLFPNFSLVSAARRVTAFTSTFNSTKRLLNNCPIPPLAPNIDTFNEVEKDTSKIYCSNKSMVLRKLYPMVKSCYADTAR